MVTRTLTVSLTLLVLSPGWRAPVSVAQDKNPDHLKMALVNMKSLYSVDHKANIQKNLDRHLYFIDKAVAKGAEFVGFPEMSLSGYVCSKRMPFLKLDGPEVRTLAKKAAENRIYVSAGMAEIDAQGKCWDTQFVIGPDGKLLGWHHKMWLGDEQVFQSEPGAKHTVLEIKGTKVGLFICADGSDYRNIKSLADKGARILYGPHANINDGTIDGWYAFRKRFAGKFNGKFIKDKRTGVEHMPAGGWCDHLNVYAAMHNHAAHYNAEYKPGPKASRPWKRWASGAWFIGPNGQTLAQMAGSTDPNDSQEFVLIYNIPLPSN